MNRAKTANKVAKKVAQKVSKIVRRRQRPARVARRLPNKRKPQPGVPRNPGYAGFMSDAYARSVLMPEITGSDKVRFPDDMPVQTGCYPFYGSYTMTARAPTANGVADCRFVINPWCGSILFVEAGSTTVACDLTQPLNNSGTGTSQIGNPIGSYADNYRVTACCVRVTYSASIINCQGMMCIGTSYGNSVTKTAIDQLKYHTKSPCATLTSRAITVPHGYEDVLFVSAASLPSLTTEYMNNTNLVFYASGVPLNATFNIDVWCCYEYTPLTALYRLVQQQTHGYQNPSQQRMNLFREVDQNPGYVTQDGNSPYWKNVVSSLPVSLHANGTNVSMVSLAGLTASGHAGNGGHKPEEAYIEEKKKHAAYDPFASKRSRITPAPEEPEQTSDFVSLQNTPAQQLMFQNNQQTMIANGHDDMDSLSQSSKGGFAQATLEYLGNGVYNILTTTGELAHSVSSAMLENAAYASKEILKQAGEEFVYQGARYVFSDAMNRIYRLSNANRLVRKTIQAKAGRAP